MAKKYELVLILDPQSGETQLEAAADNYQKRLEAAGAEVVQVVKWGLRKLAYTSIALRQRQQGFYVLYQFLAESERLGRWRRISSWTSPCSATWWSPFRASS